MPHDWLPLLSCMCLKTFSSRVLGESLFTPDSIPEFLSPYKNSHFLVPASAYWPISFLYGHRDSTGKLGLPQGAADTSGSLVREGGEDTVGPLLQGLGSDLKFGSGREEGEQRSPT